MARWSFYLGDVSILTLAPICLFNPLQDSMGRTRPAASSPDTDDAVEGSFRSPRQQGTTRPPRHASSKYDFVKVTNDDRAYCQFSEGDPKFNDT